MARIAVVGVGAIGGTLAAELATAGHDLTLCVHTRFEQLVVTMPDRELRPAARIIVDPSEAPAVDWVILATKAHQTESARAWLDVFASARLAVAQNGVEHRERVGRDCVPVVVALSASRSGAGEVRASRAGRLVVPFDADARAFAELWKDTPIEVEPTADFVTAAWRKLAWNVAGGAVTALTDRPMSVVRRADIAELARGLIREVIEVGRAEGAALDETHATTMVEAMQSGRPDATPSTLQDRRAGRPIEYDARNGAVVRIGARHGIATPLNAAVTALLATISDCE
jgi:2-dehydropantoate 2-reductase